MNGGNIENWIGNFRAPLPRLYHMKPCLHCVYCLDHSQSLLDGRLRYEGSIHGYSGQLLDQTRTLMAGCDIISLQLLRLRTLAPVRYSTCACKLAPLI